MGGPPLTLRASGTGKPSKLYSKVSVGLSEIVAPNGQIIHRASPNEPELFSYDIDVTQARDKRINPYNDLLRDRQPQWYVEQ